MTLLKTVPEKDATGVVKQVYNGFTERLGRVPNIVKFHTASTTTYGYMMGVLNEFAEHPQLDPILINYLRIIIPHRFGGEYCVAFQSALIKARGISNEAIEIAKNNPEELDLPSNQKALLLFALDVLSNKHEGIAERLEELRVMGWTDQNIYELCYLGGSQLGMLPLINAFQVERDY